MLEVRPNFEALRSAALGEALADDLSAWLRRGESVRVDLAAVEIMTPSFANALVMTLLDRFSLADLQARCAFVNRTDAVVESMNRAVLRYQQGIRLSNQLDPATNAVLVRPHWTAEITTMFSFISAPSSEQDRALAPSS